MMNREHAFEIQCDDCDGRTVTWTKKSFQEHVKRRPELKSLKNKIIECVQKPSHRVFKLKGIEYFYSDVLRYSRNGEARVKVIIGYRGIWKKTGAIRTAYIVLSLDD